MRLVGDFTSQTAAQRFIDAMSARGIPTELDERGEGSVYSLWVQHDQDADAAAKALQEYMKNPDGFAARAQGARLVVVSGPPKVKPPQRARSRVVWLTAALVVIVALLGLVFLWG